MDDGELIMWSARADTTTYVAIFWTGASTRKVSMPVASVGARPSAVHDLWDGTAHLVTEHLESEIPPHGVRWLRLT